MTSALRLPHYDGLHDNRTETGHTPLLDHLRHAARDARCKSYVDLFGACASLSVNRDIARQAASDVLMRCLSQALGRRPILFRAGEPEISFDEDWLLALARSIRREDTASCTFLLHSRVPKHAHRNLVFLLGNVADNFPQI
ncbi:hypothetical protein PVV74_21580 [Roseovarius sp. SK2]|jgi:hypothetical protein|uniref:hypothetical protein n=1 Tax=Roseovarius TaxID=74030 RepID=UPI00237AEA79|nr:MULTISPECIES: hypothetical protein [unclassified Roseovarius]MDD9728047.1 hypothetical protein [Roseovarius sp. SK2]